MRKKLSVLFIVFFLSFLAATSYSDSISNDILKIGVIFAKTGNAAVVTKSGFDAARFAADEINKNGGILGKKIVLMEYDNKSNSLGSKFAAIQAVNDGVTGVIGSVFSAHSLAAAEVLQDANIPMISPLSTNVAVTLVGDYIFRVCYVDTFQGRIASDFAQRDLNAGTAVVLTNSSSKYSLGLAEIFIGMFNRHGSVLWEGYYQEDITDFTIPLRKIQNINPDVIFVPGHFRESAYIIKQARALGLETVFIGGDGWVGKMYKYSGKAINGSFFITQWHQSIAFKENQEFVKNYLKVYEKLDEPLIALTYDAVHVLSNAVKKAGSLNRATIRTFLAKTKDFPGVTGKITFDENGDTIDKSAVIMKFENGSAIFQKTITP
ncbi:MAG: ABC transporter substrate-binding protein [Desulfobacteraceae bacterium]|nr:ABC transporter substrate-binding protein [Desulfobacteraceae bacterium]